MQKIGQPKCRELLVDLMQHCNGSNFHVLAKQILQASVYLLIFFNYRPQRSWGKVIFSQACVILSTGGVCLSACWDTTPPGADIPLEQTPPGADIPKTRHPPDQAPPRPGTPLSAEHAGRYGQRAGGMHPTGMQSR